MAVATTGSEEDLAMLLMVGAAGWVGAPVAAARAAAEAGGKGATAICWAVAALTIVGRQTTKRVADGAINNQPLREEEENLAPAVAEVEVGGGRSHGDLLGGHRG